ncbi:MAG: phosphotransferase family protein [Acidimicrobiales bacterium]
MGDTDVEHLGVNGPRVTTWFEEQVEGVTPPLTFDLIAGGHSNLTYRVTDASGRDWVLRRPPLGHLLATAHDMSREHRIVAALGDSPVPVAPAIGLCTDGSVNGAPFYVMGFVDGLVVRNADDARTHLRPDARRRAGESMIDVLAALHAIDPDTVGLGDLGRKDGYLERQLKRWHGQWQQSQPPDIPAVDEVHDLLLRRVPPQGPPAIVHGDYRLDNCMVDPSGRLRAVLDWELCTLGDPLADVGLLMVYWTEPGDPHSALLGAPTVAEGFASRDELLARYGERSGRDLSGIDYYLAFGHWKLACIIAGVYDRYRHGALGTVDEHMVDGFGAQIETLAQLAAESAARVD